VEEGEEEGSQDASEAANAQSREQAQPQHAHELATAGPDATAAAHDADRAHTAAAWAMPPPPPRPRPSGIVAAAAPAAQALHQQAPATAASGHQEASVQPASLAAHDSFGFAAIEAEGELGAFGAELGTLEDPIAHRTRCAAVRLLELGSDCSPGSTCCLVRAFGQLAQTRPALALTCAWAAERTTRWPSSALRSWSRCCRWAAG
jgi:hypothetical protein